MLAKSCCHAARSAPRNCPPASDAAEATAAAPPGCGSESIGVGAASLIRVVGVAGLLATPPGLGTAPPLGPTLGLDEELETVVDNWLILPDGRVARGGEMLTPVTGAATGAGGGAWRSGSIHTTAIATNPANRSQSKPNNTVRRKPTEALVLAGR